jgi:preprotein translocase subunit SecE
VAEKTVKVKQPVKIKEADTAMAEKPKPVQKAAPRAADKDREKPKKENAIARWYRETIGELRKVSWPTTQDAWRLTRIVLIVMFAMSAILGLLDFLFSQLITLLVS